MMFLWRTVLFLVLIISYISAENYENQVTALERVKEQFLDLQRLEENIEDSSLPSLDTIKDTFEDLVRLNCNFHTTNFNSSLRKVYQVFERQQEKILQNAEDLKLIKKIAKNLSTLLLYKSAEKADDITKMGFKQTETLPTSVPLEKSANKTKTVQTMSQQQQYSNYTIPTITTTTTTTEATPYLSSKHSKDLPAGIADCETPPLPSAYCPQYQVLWYFSTEEGRCNRFRRGCEETSRNSYKSQAECKSQCVSPGFKEGKACFLPRSPGICNGIETRWFFDWRENRCRDFIYSGCLGNQNRFQDEEACWQNCGSSTLPLDEELEIRSNIKPKADYKSEQIIDTEVKHQQVLANRTYHLPSLKKVHSNDEELEKRNSIQSSFPENPYEGHPEYIPLKQQNVAKISQTTSKQVEHRLTPSKYQLPSMKEVPAKYQRLVKYNSIQSSLNNNYDGHYPDYLHLKEQNSAKTAQTISKNIKHRETSTRYQPRLQKVQSIPQKHKKLKSTQGTFHESEHEGHHTDDIQLRQENLVRKNKQIHKIPNRKNNVFKGSFQNKKRKYRKFLYMFNDREKRRSKVSKTLNLRVELHAPKDIKSGRLFKLKCIVSGSLAEAVEIIWDSDDETDEKKKAGWKQRERIDVKGLSFHKTSTLYVPGIYSPVRFTCLVSCYDPQAAQMLPEKLRNLEKVERVENFLCAFDSVKLKPNDEN
eukprot:GFUD01039908.1.p1 GENE.GFUD01039908.1~~GFUD01039908.1.p1  ORF type:complete len:704 (-),score=134.54 GFUD01039908.1:114-2225(-)